MSKTDDIHDRLRRAEWLMRPETQRILAMLDGASGRTRAVGGIVRDTVLGLPTGSTDIDLATELLPDEVSARAAKAGVSVYPTGIEHGTVTLKLEALVAEVTTLREDVETNGRHAVVRFGADWVRDAQRRDFTLNALYARMDGSLFDPLGGLDDCLGGKVRFIGRPEKRIAEDRLRVYRFFRFSASHGGEVLDRDGLAACQAAAGTLGQLAAERVGAEMRRMLDLPKVANTLKAMLEAGILPVPAALVGLLHSYERRVQRPQYVARLALLRSGLSADELRVLWRLSNDDLRGADAVLAVAALLRAYKLHEAAYRHPAALGDGVEVAAVLANWGEAGKLAVREQLQDIDVPRFPISGTDLLGLGMAPGRALGLELERLEQLWVESGFSLSGPDLLSLVETQQPLR